MSIFEKDWKEWIDSFDLLKRLTRSIHSEKTSHSQKKTYFSYVFDSFSPDKRVKIDRIDLLSLIFEKDRPEAKGSCQLTVRESTTGVIQSFSWSHWSFDRKKRAIRWKNQWSKSQPCPLLDLLQCRWLTCWVSYLLLILTLHGWLACWVSSSPQGR